jgi:uncharacterized YccA/Bax inhibitor family protein
VRSSNPVLTRLTPPQYGSGGYAPAPSPGASYPSPVVSATTDRMTVDDVVVRTVGMLAVTVVSAALSWAIVPEAYIGAVWIGAVLVGLVVGLGISFSGSTNPVFMLTYAVIEGVFLGVFSHAYEIRYSGIVVQAVLATVGVFFIMSLLYKSKVIRATPRFNRILFGCLAGAVFVILGNLLLSAFGVSTPINGNGPIALLFAAAMVVLGALTFVTDFDLIERGVAAGLPKRYAWTCAFGLLVGLIFVYIYVVRLLGILRSN